MPRIKRKKKSIENRTWLVSSCCMCVCGCERSRATFINSDDDRKKVLFLYQMHDLAQNKTIKWKSKWRRKKNQIKFYLLFALSTVFLLLRNLFDRTNYTYLKLESNLNGYCGWLSFTILNKTYMEIMTIAIAVASTTPSPLVGESIFLWRLSRVRVRVCVRLMVVCAYLADQNIGQLA